MHACAKITAYDTWDEVWAQIIALWPEAYVIEQEDVERDDEHELDANCPVTRYASVWRTEADRDDERRTIAFVEVQEK